MKIFLCTIDIFLTTSHKKFLLLARNLFLQQEKDCLIISFNYQYLLLICERKDSLILQDKRKYLNVKFAPKTPELLHKYHAILMLLWKPGSKALPKYLTWPLNNGWLQKQINIFFMKSNKTIVHSVQRWPSICVTPCSSSC